MNHLVHMLVVPVVVVAACVAPDGPAETEVQSAGTSFQGTSFQGTSFQGTSFQGTSFQGTSFQGAAYGSSAISDGSLSGTTLSVWLPRNNVLYPWEQRLPNKICYWNAARTSSSGCTTVGLNTSPSPLAGVSFQATFVRNDGTTFQATLRIGTSTTEVGAVKADNSSALFPLTGSGATGGLDHRSSCTHADGCRINSDLWLYDVHLVDIVDPDTGAPISFCPAGNVATPLAGTWDSTGQHAGSSTGQFTFACTNGTIVKCTRWGYRPWASAIKSGPAATSTLYPLADYHQACIRAASADYCARGHSFTKDHTLVDIYDYQPHQSSAAGFIPRTTSVLWLLGQSETSLVWESSFDKRGATSLDFLRYQELVGSASYGSLVDPAVGCPGTFSIPEYYPPGEDVRHITYERDYSTWTTPSVSIETTSVCSHSELTEGKWLHPGCSTCTDSLWTPDSDHLSCVSSSGTWNASCVRAAQGCAERARMAAHSECMAGVGLPKYGSGCTLAVCLDPAHASCCTASGWTSTCVDAANATCTGGQESLVRGFCGSPI